MNNLFPRINNLVLSYYFVKYSQVLFIIWFVVPSFFIYNRILSLLVGILIAFWTIKTKIVWQYNIQRLCWRCSMSKWANTIQQYTNLFVYNLAPDLWLNNIKETWTWWWPSYSISMLTPDHLPQTRNTVCWWRQLH